MAPITLRNIVKHYGNLTVIEDLSLAIEDREFIVLVGPSGCGKSTLLRILAGLEEVTSGDILIGDDRVNGLPASKRDIAMVFQDYALYPHMTVRQNMAFALEMRGLSKSDIDERVRRAAELLAIGEFLDRRPKALSGGQRQRVAMGRAIVRDPRVFLFDEPLSNLDAKLRAQVRAEIKALSQQIQTTMVFVTHDQVEAMTMADRIVVMKSGVIQQIGTPEEVYERPANQFVAGFIGSPAMNFMPAELTDGRLRVGEDTAFAAADLYSTEPRPLSDAPLQFGIRPEHFVVAPDEKEAIRAEVQLVEPLGSDTYIHFRFAGYNTIARVAPDLRPKPGDVVPLMPARDKAHLFDGRSGQAIR